MSQHKLAVLLSTVALATACSSGMQVSHDLNPAADFSAFTTFGWMEEAEARPSSQQLVELRVKSAVESELVARGLRQSANPSLLVAWDAATEGKMSASTTGSSYGTGYYGRYRRGWGGGMAMTQTTTTVNEWTEGTLIIDIIDAEREQLVYHGSAQAKLQEDATPEERTRLINEAVAKILETVPVGN